MDNQDGTLDRNQVFFKHKRLQEFVRQLFIVHGLPDEDDEIAAYGLIKANLRGVDSHGVARVPMYCLRLRRGVAKARPDIRIERFAPAAKLVDGDDGLGLVVGRRGMMEAITLARKTGIGLVGVKRSGHFFIALKAELFLPIEVFEERMQVLASRVKSQPLAAGFKEILMPGEPEYRREQERLRQGIPLSADVVESLQQEARRAGVPFC